jgi:antitoxin component YwqK of YwqJK toxin-antitoxin module
MFKIIISLLLLLGIVSAETQKSYYPDGTIKSATSYKNGKRNGIEHIYYPDGATLMYAKPYVNDKVHGILQAYRPNAMLKYETVYKYGVLDGRSRYYSDKGLLKAEIDYIRGLKDGKMSLFYPSGLLKIETFWKKGRLISGYIFQEDSSRRVFSSDEKRIFFEVNR